MYEIDKKNLGSYIAERRKEKGFTQKQLAEKLYISDKAVSKWETGMSIPDASLWVPLADLLGVSVTELLAGQNMASAEPMDANQVENLIKKAISVSDDNPQEKKRIKQQRIMIYCVCLILGCVLNVFYFMNGGPVSSLITYDILGVVFGLYFCFFAKDRLPAYYDENKVSCYSDGFFRMNVPGLSFNNSNFPHIMQAGRIWSCVVMVLSPTMECIVFFFMPPVCFLIWTFASLGIALGGLFIPMYVVGKKYQ